MSILLVIFQTYILIHLSTLLQVHGYLIEPPIPRNESPLQYWKSNMSRFPALTKAACKYLSAPCTSVDSERLFSAASHIVDEKRNRIQCEKAEMLLFVKKNLPLLMKQAWTITYSVRWKHYFSVWDIYFEYNVAALSWKMFKDYYVF